MKVMKLSTSGVSPARGWASASVAASVLTRLLMRIERLLLRLRGAGGAGSWSGGGKAGPSSSSSDRDAAAAPEAAGVLGPGNWIGGGGGAAVVPAGAEPGGGPGMSS